MTDQIYYKIQYPIKKAISILKKVDPDSPFTEENNKNITAEIEGIKSFLDFWEEEGEENIKELIKKLRDSQ